MSAIIAKTPPMGWNSWDCFGTSVTEAEVIANTDYMAAHLKPYGWEYIIVDIQWYEPDAESSHYRPFVPLEMDEYGRLLPSVKRFPSAAEGKGFKPLADYVHSQGLKFGMHIMRGIPRQAVHSDTQVLGSAVTARKIAHTNSICPWNTDMYGVNPNKPGAQEYYNSLFNLYAEWGVDFIKVDDIAQSKLYGYHKGEVELVHKAIGQCGRDIVLSLSPGPAPVEEGDHLRKHANMWRMTDDYWDDWKDLIVMFDKCHSWAPYVGLGHWPDADMLPLGHLAIRSRERNAGNRLTRFTKDEQRTMMTLWCMFRSPLMFGGHMPDNDEWTLSLLTNEEVLRILSHSYWNRQLFRDGDRVAWTAKDEGGDVYLALFNLGSEEISVSVDLDLLELTGSMELRDLWEQKYLPAVIGRVEAVVPSHGCVLYKLSQ
ncbi:alpha-galactosidase [Paenibacillus sp. LMG 31456]|uniref:Alpha-galactosidase n=1 Tax=Paenibacillus foliorum TaxID=2654974 RepID=A0A972K346_9BACL|nr:glycoside hydrolase family 27 protein [Paenibacillus foliorum]NOU94552.1 alpha-galactosidase [Paenibacillus foliorum]